MQEEVYAYAVLCVYIYAVSCVYGLIMTSQYGALNYTVPTSSGHFGPTPFI